MTGLSAKKIVGKKVTEAIPGIEKDPADWIGVYGIVALQGKEIKFEQYSEFLKKWYAVTAYSPMKDCFAVIFEEVTQRKQLESERKYLISDLKKKTADLEKAHDQIALKVQELEIANEELGETKNILEDFAKNLEFKVEEKTRELQNAQDQLIRSEKLAVLGKMAASLSHQLRNPLAVIKNAVYYLNSSNKADIVIIETYLDIIARQIQIAVKIINGTFNFARPKEIRQEKSDINDAINMTLQNIIIPEHITIVKELKQISKISHDSFQLSQALENIIINSIDSIIEKGKINIKTEKKGDSAQIHVNDSGVGMTQEDIECIFDPLFSKKAKGVGFGMTVVKDIIDMHRWTIHITSEKHKGTTVSINMPL